MPSKWKERPLDPDYLIDSGLLFEVNHQVLHLVGIALAVEADDKGNKRLVLLDSRDKPEEWQFSTHFMDICTQKLQQFMKDFGAAQLERRRAKLGWACQPKS